MCRHLNDGVVYLDVHWMCVLVCSVVDRVGIDLFVVVYLYRIGSEIGICSCSCVAVPRCRQYQTVLYEGVLLAQGDSNTARLENSTLEVPWE